MKNRKIKEKKLKNPFQVGFFMLKFLGFWVGFFGANPGSNAVSVSAYFQIINLPAVRITRLLP